MEILIAVWSFAMWCRRTCFLPFLKEQKSKLSTMFTEVETVSFPSSSQCCLLLVPHHCIDDFPHSVIFHLHLHFCFQLILSPRWVWVPPFGFAHNAISHLLVVGFFGTSSAWRQWGEWLRWQWSWWIVFGGWGCGTGCHLVHRQGFCCCHEFNCVGEGVVGLEGLPKGGLSPFWCSSRHHIIIPCWCLLWFCWEWELECTRFVVSMDSILTVPCWMCLMMLYRSNNLLTILHPPFSLDSIHAGV